MVVCAQLRFSGLMVVQQEMALNKVASEPLNWTTTEHFTKTLSTSSVIDLLISPCLILFFTAAPDSSLLH